jgi:hypothetical protein
MSWSVSATGRAPAVAVEIAKQLASKCAQPEETVKNSLGVVIAVAN